MHGLDGLRHELRFQKQLRAAANADDRISLDERQVGLERRNGARGKANHQEAAVAANQTTRTVKERSAADFVADVAAIGQSLAQLLQPLLLVLGQHHHRRCAEIETDLLLFLRRNGADNLTRAALFRHLNGKGAHAARRARDEHALPLAQLAPLHQSVVGRRIAHKHCARLHGRQMRRRAKDNRFVGHHFAPTPVCGKGNQHEVAHAHSLHSWPHFGHHAGQLRAGAHWQRILDLVPVAHGKQVEEVERNGAHGDADVSGRGKRSSRERLPLQALNGVVKGRAVFIGQDPATHDR